MEEGDIVVLLACVKNEICGWKAMESQDTLRYLFDYSVRAVRVDACNACFALILSSASSFCPLAIHSSLFVTYLYWHHKNDYFRIPSLKHWHGANTSALSHSLSSLSFSFADVLDCVIYNQSVFAS